jgi:hypothetical protein
MSLIEPVSQLSGRPIRGATLPWMGSAPANDPVAIRPPTEEACNLCLMSDRLRESALGDPARIQMVQGEMSPQELADNIAAEARRFIIAPTGSWYLLKDEAYRPWEPYSGSLGRYNGRGTGSIYLGNSLETCIREVGSVGKWAYAVDVSAVAPREVLDLVGWSRENPELSGSLLIQSSSGGWEPTLEVSKRVHEMGFQGIQFLSQHGDSGINLVIWTDRATISEPMFVRQDAGTP